MGRIRRAHRALINNVNRLRLKNRDFSLIANNCNGSLILRELGVRYNSPFVNCMLWPDDYIRLLQNLEHYLACEMQITRVEGNWAYGQWDDLKVDFSHFDDVNEVKRKWDERMKRIDPDNLFIMFTARDGCTMEHLRAFAALPYKNKVVFTHLPYPEIRSACYIKGFEKEPCVGELYKFRYKRLGIKYFDSFDYVSWFNNGK